MSSRHRCSSPSFARCSALFDRNGAEPSHAGEPRVRRVAAQAVGAMLALLASAGAAGAQDQAAVYDPLPPPGSAYVRFVNATGVAVSVQPDFLPAQQLGTVDAGRLTAYLVAERVAGRALGVQVQGGGIMGQATLRAEPGSFVTVIVEPGEGALALIPVVDRTVFNQNRARLAFYNAMPGCASAAITLADSKAAVFRDVAPGAAKARSVNPVAAPVRALCGGEPAAALTLEGMEAGGMYSIWLMQPGPAALAFLARDTTAKWKP